MWEFVCFGVATMALLTYVYVAKLYKFKGTKLKNRMNYSLTLSLIFTLLFLWETHGEMEIIGKGLMLGIFLSIPFSLYTKKWIDKKIEGTTIFYKKRQYLRFIWVIPTFILFQIFINQDVGKQIIAAKWPILGLSFAWFIDQLFIFSYIIKREKTLGKPILEDTK